jgi:A/G-specific adenine glycosylase
MPWRARRTPYRVFVSEIMLQQTSVPRVMSRYAEFIRAFPSFKRLATATVQEVIQAWKGLGYNRRALALRESARRVTSVHHGRLPRTVENLVQLPGVGHATAAAVIVYTFNVPIPFIETNIRRVFIHTYFKDQENVPDAVIAPLVEHTMDRNNPREWYYALMDYGTALAAGRQNANRRSSRYRVQSKFEGSLRQLRGRILAVIMEQGSATRRQIKAALGADPRVDAALRQLEKEGFLRAGAGRYTFK